ncbi:putative ABC transporter ATP-binding protein YbhF [Posidoniimonas polymericola]|uniref:Putative ABC transporter ATP-binding protein YbhF n=2 Tax=Posidoniimonas polymericola TaxID=2528002 RepID=A0A5C5YMK5_9BACT|nr:ABC transporter ATP-binding protein [Posidoniimonas polymericola]TWT76037.1 putative ABC transporter ATP-binding protein YbhF [Posidoniimonas polymericola]
MSDSAPSPDPSAGEPMIETRGLTKKYGELFAIREININLCRGDVFGFIGPNGAGKTTTMRILATLLTPTWGEAYVGGHSIYTKPKEIRRTIGYMPDFFGVYDDMKVIEYLEFFAAAYRIDGDARRKKCDEVLGLVDLEFKREALATSLSRGMTQRLGLARVLLHDPEVLLLDEPASGLDPRARIEMRNLLKRLRGLGKTIMVSSHILPELADICNKVGIIERGELVYNDTVESLLSLLRKQLVIRVRVAESQDQAAESLRMLPVVDKVETVGDELHATLQEGSRDPSDLSAKLVGEGYRVQLLAEKEIDLETAFMTLTKGITA